METRFQLTCNAVDGGGLSLRSRPPTWNPPSLSKNIPTDGTFCHLALMALQNGRTQQPKTGSARVRQSTRSFIDCMQHDLVVRCFSDSTSLGANHVAAWSPWAS